MSLSKPKLTSLRATLNLPLRSKDEMIKLMSDVTLEIMSDTISDMLIVID